MVFFNIFFLEITSEISELTLYFSFFFWMLRFSMNLRVGGATSISFYVSEVFIVY